MSEGQTGRRRRDPRDAEREIIDAAEAFLAEQPFRALTVDAVMARTGLSRPAFYVYFRDRYALVTAILGRIGAELFEVDRAWLESPAGDSREALRGTVTAAGVAFARRGRLLRAIADAAATDPTVEHHYRGGLLAGFAAAITARVERGIRDGEMLPQDDPAAVALALVLMTERTLLDAVSRGGEEALVAVVPALAQIWERTLYPPA